MEFDPMAPMGMIFVLVLLAILAWIVTSIVGRAIDLQKTRIMTRANVTAEQEYRRLAQQATQAQQELAGQLQRLDGIEARLGAIEAMLREVDEPVAPRR
ncbi:MAG: hypothetical protein WD734_04370 [Dehalococcoidia bacterium]